MLRSLPLASLGLLCTTAAFAQVAPVTQVGDTLVFENLGYSLIMPLPDWDGDAPIPLDLLQTYDDASDNEALIEFLPEGQDFESWSELYWARLAVAPDLKPDDMRGFTIAGFSKICKGEETSYFTPDDDDGARISPLVFVCGEHGEGFGLDGLGEIMMTAYRKTGDGLAIVTVEWRGPAFAVADTAAWPIDKAALTGRARALDAAISLEVSEN
ncbi:MAG: hypothetical protein JWR75_704 [Devosia sp.]|nr:hypothetical protein [Devosia sp.]